MDDHTTKRAELHLPPLPKAEYCGPTSEKFGEQLFTASQMREYGRICRDERGSRFVEDLAAYGLRFDTCPTRRLHENNPIAAEIDAFWADYFRRANDSIRERARAILQSKEVQ